MAAPDLRDFILGTSALQPGEEPIAYVRPSVRLLWGEVLQAVAVVGITLLAPFAFYTAVRSLTGQEDPEFAAATFGAGAVGFELLYLAPRIVRAWIHVAFTEYVLTTNRIYSRTEFLSTDLRVVPYERVTMLLVRRNLMERVLGIARVHVRAYGDVEQQIRLRGLRDPWPLFRVAREGLRTHNTADAIVRSD